MDHNTGPACGRGVRWPWGRVETGANSRTYEARPVASSRRRVAMSRDVRRTPWRS
jgi:hypothetical protein